MAMAACAPQAHRLAAASLAYRSDVSWAFEKSDIPVDPAFRFGRLANGMRYVVRRNTLPAGTAIVRLDVAAGSLDEAPSERGYAHFIEHMAFEGSTHVPGGEMVRLLERNGLAFGADTNASTGFEQTNYRLDLPNADPKLIDTALMLMRETASELTFDPQAVERQRGVVLSEMRDRNDWAYRNGLADARFFAPQALYPERFPIGTAQTVGDASADALKAFWRREYVPAHATLMVIGDIDVAKIEARIRARFDDWRAAPAEPIPEAGPITATDHGRTAIAIDPALAERITVARNRPWLDEPDTVAQRRENLLRQIGYGIVNRRLIRIARRPNAPFRGAGFGTGDIFEAGRVTRLIVDTVDGGWRTGLPAAAREYRRALHDGFTTAEVAEQVAGIRVQAQVAATSAETRGNQELAEAALGLARDRTVPSDPRTALARLIAFIPDITPARVMAALRRETVPLKDPLIRFQGRRQPVGGELAIRNAWHGAMRGAFGDQGAVTPTSFAYTDFGVPGAVASDTIGPLGIRQLRFANGVLLNLKRTDIEKGAILLRVGIDGGDRLDTKPDPLTTAMVGSLPLGGLGKHSEDDLQSILAGRAVGIDFDSVDDRFIEAARTTPDDLSLQLALAAAFLTDPGYRAEGETQYRLQINNFFASKDATPASALRNAIGGILSDDDPRFTLQPVDAYRALTFARLKAAITDRLAHGAIEVSLVGDFDDTAVIRQVATTFGALPAREPAFGSFANQPPRPFTANHERRIVRHTGPDNQAIVRFTWRTRDDTDPIETLQLELLERIVRIQLTEGLRERLGKAYSPSAVSLPSHVWHGYGQFGVSASVDVKDVGATQAAILDAIGALRAASVDPDLLERARAPMVQAFDNGLKTNFGWLGLVERAQTEPDRIARYRSGKASLQAISAADIQVLAARYLGADRAVEVVVLPQGVATP